MTAPTVAAPGHQRHALLRRIAAGFRLTSAPGAVLLLLGLGQGTTACAVTHLSGPPESVTVASTSEFPPTAHTRVIRYPAGHTVITRDIHGTDTTVQGTPDHLMDQGAWQWSDAFRQWGDTDADERYGWRPPPRAEQPSPSLRDDYRRRMLERLDGYP
jgi:hypothetical protein